MVERSHNKLVVGRTLQQHDGCLYKKKKLWGKSDFHGLHIQLNMASRDLAKGSKFDSYTGIENALQEYEKKNFVQFYKRSSRSIEVFEKRYGKKIDNKDLMLCELHLHCFHGGRQIISP